MKKRTKITVSLVLVACLLLSSLPSGTLVVAVETDGTLIAPTIESLTDEIQPVLNESTIAETASGDVVSIVQEDVSLRKEYEKHFLLSDGSYQVALYNEPIHKIEDGKWVEIDNTLALQTSADGTAQYRTVNGLVDVSFSQSFEDQLVTMRQDDYSVSWGVQAFSSSLSMNTSAELVQSVQAELVTSDLSTFSVEEQKTLATKSSSTIQYRNALRQNVDLEYVVLPSRIKENIILQSAQDISYYMVTVYTENLSARLLENREIEFYNDSDEVIFTMTSPYMYDSAGELSEDITIEMVSKGDGCYFVKMTPDIQWLSDESRVYPVVIDPQVSVDTTRTNIIDNYVLKGAGVQNRNLDRLYIGQKSDSIARAFIKYDTMPTIPAGSTITAATMTLTLTNGTDTAANASAYKVTGGDWASDTITWANMPAASTALATNISHNNLTGYTFSCKAAVQSWYSGSTTGQNANYGIMLRYYSESVADYNAVYSADYTDESKRPALSITYQPPTSSVSVLEGYTYQLSLSGVTGTVTWTSSSKSIATVNSSGKVTGVKAGKATITASVDGTVQKTFTVYVKIANGVYYIKNYASGYYMSAENGRFSSGTRIVQTPKAASVSEGLWQLWKVQYLSNGQYSIRPLHKLDMGIRIYSAPTLENIGTTDTSASVNAYARWSINWTTNGYVFKNAGKSGYALCTSSSADDGAYINIASYANGTVFRWTLEKKTGIANQVLLQDSRTGASAESITQCVKLGETVTLGDMGITASFASAYSIDQSITWSTVNTSVVSVNSSTGAVTGLTGGKTATIIAKHIYNGVGYEKSYKIYIAKADEFIFQTVHYYDNGYNLREGNAAASAIQSYHDIVTTRFERIFGVKLVETIVPYSSPCDKCKIQQYGTVSAANLDRACNHSPQCLNTANVRTDLLSQKGSGTGTKTVVSWSGHRMTDFENDRSNSVASTHSIVMTTYGISDWDDADEKAANRTYTLLHELSHQLAAPDHYCYGKDTTGYCNNKSCDECYFGYSDPRDCVMSFSYDISTLSDDEMYCDDCLETIRTHLENHH